MTQLVPARETRDDRDRVYARLETVGATGTVTSVRLGTLAASFLELDPVLAARREDGVVPMANVTEHHADEISADFDARPLSAFVDELTRQTPYDRHEAEVVVTCGWFDMDEHAAVRAINDHLRGPYEEWSVETLADHRRRARETNREIRAADDYPFGL